MEDLFTNDENEILRDVLNKKKKVVDELMKDGVDTSPRSIEVLNSALASLEDSVFKKANMRLRNKSEENANNRNELVAELLRTPMKELSTMEINNNPILGDDVIPADILPGENEILPEKLNPDDFMPNNEEL